MYGRVSENTMIRRMIGIALIIASVIFCLLPIIQIPVKEDKYKSASPQWVMKKIATERNGTVNINDADADALTELPGIGETISSMIISERTTNGPFYYAEDLEAVRGIGARTMEKFRDMIDMSKNGSDE